ncbi:Coq4 family protein [Qipengyuania sp. S6317L1]|uniref:Coq4 family protein n=1 Tax=Qipengyuania sp. S6317L1 TaxID=2926410 RepID=UPI001FF4B97D|nr:Coq4 family protein [Qipengyuania sp. S6317L1]MCK0098013.1 Coq4 family protein [Qipengyuania sp. S6317L1]
MASRVDFNDGADLLKKQGRQSETKGQDAGASSFLLQHAGDNEGGVMSPDTISRITPTGVETLPINHPDRVRPKFDFGKGWKHLRILVKDKDRTDELFGVLDSMPWRAVGEEAAAFLATDRGKHIYQTEPYLPDILDDHARLRQMPKGSFADIYCNFMESEGLTAAGLIEEANVYRKDSAILEDGIEWYNNRLRDTHDILHVLTGYGRDTLGEQCLLAFLFDQRPSPGHLFLGWLGTLLMKMKLPTKAPVLRAFLQARRNGRLTQRIVEQPILDLLPLPIEEVRRRLNILEPTTYHQALDIWEGEGVDPHALLGRQPA